MFSPEQNNYAYGWHVYDVNGHHQYSHGGYLPGWNSYIFYYPEDTLSIIVLCNVEDASPMELCSNISRVIYLNRLDQHEMPPQEKYAGRYAIDLQIESNELPFEAEIVTVNEDGGSLKVKTPKGKTLRFTRLAQDEWQDTRAEMRLKFRETGGNVFLQVSKNGHQWRWRKLSGDYQPAGNSH
ncbi:MAG TPA: hypothetical protein ENJ82_18160 [Bacteroidetes bacterium]|nr:hypothetical protein [Bacteroidota bacterium]